jgi:hypothetical protein
MRNIKELGDKSKFKSSLPGYPDPGFFIIADPDPDPDPGLFCEFNSKLKKKKKKF